MTWGGSIGGGCNRNNEKYLFAMPLILIDKMHNTGSDFIKSIG